MSNINVNNLTPLLGSGSSVSVSGSLVVKNDVTIGGHLYIGDADTDSVTFSAEVSSSVVPDANITYDLGSSVKQWKELYLNSLVVKHITASGNISASGTGINGTGSFHHVYSNGEVLASGTGSFDQGMIASNSSSLTYASMSGALVTSYHISASRGLFTATGDTQVGLEVYHTASIGYISASGDMTMSGTASFGGGIDALNASASIQYLHVQENISGSASGSLNDLFVNDAVEIQGVTVIHGNISSSNNVSASFGYVSSSGDISASGTGSFASGVVTDGTATGSFGYISASGDVSSAGTGSFFGGVDAAAATGSFGYISASGDISTSTNIHGVQYYTDSLIFATGDQASNTVKLGGGNSVTRIHGLSIDVSGSISMSGDITMTGSLVVKESEYSKFELDGAGALPTIDNDTIAIFQRNQPGGSTAAITILAHAAGESILKLGDTDDEDIGRIRYMHSDNSMDFLTNNTQQMSIDSLGNVKIEGDVSASGRVSASNGFQAGTLSTSSFGYLSASGTAYFGGATVVINGDAGHITASGNISGGAAILGGDYYTQGLQFATQTTGTSGVLQIGGSQPMRIIGTSLMVTGSVSMSGALSMSGANADIITEGAISTLGAVSSSGALLGNTAQFANNGVNTLSITNSGAISSSSTISGLNLVLKHSGVHKTSIDANGNIAAEGAVSASGAIEGGSLNITNNGNNVFSVDINGTLSASRGFEGNQLRVSSDGASKFLVDGSGNVAAEGYVSSSALMSATSLNIKTEGVTKARIDVSGNIAAEGIISSSGLMSATSLNIKTEGVHKASIDASGNIAAEGNVSASGNVYGTAHYVGGGGALIALSGGGGIVKMGGASSGTAIHGISIDVTGSVSMSGALSMSGANAEIITEGGIYALGAISSSDKLKGAYLDISAAGVHKASIDTSGNIAAEGDISSSGLIAGRSATFASDGINALTITTAGALSASSTIAGTALTLSTTGNTYATIDALGTGSFLGGIDCIGDGRNATGSFGYISCSQDVSSSGTVFGEALIVGAGNSIVNGNIKFNGGIVRPLKSITGDIVLDATSGVFADAGKTIVLNAAGGCSVVLPAAGGSGNVYEFYVGTAITSGAYVVKVADASDTFIGAVHMIDADDDSQTSITAKGTDDTLTLNGGTTGGGLLGDTIKFTDIATNKYVVQGNIIVVAGSNPADPFSATV